MHKVAGCRNLTLFFLISLLSFSLASYAQENSLPAPSISAYLEEEISVEGICY